MKKGFMILVMIFVMVLLLPAVTKSEETEEITGKAIATVYPDHIELSWDNTNLMDQKVAIATECITDETIECNWIYQDVGQEISIFEDYDITPRLKFYQIKAKKKIGQGTCIPECSEGEWYEPCEEEFLKADDQCEGKFISCCFEGTEDEGWYDEQCNETQNQSNNLVILTQCGSDEIPIICNKTSDIFVKFTQPLNYLPGELSINWFVFTKDPASEEDWDESEDALASEVIDYVAFWDAKKQYYYGAAKGDSPLGQEVVTGNFEFKQYNPYFVSATTNTEITWAGKLLEHQIFKFKYITNYMGESKDAENFLVLPFDTKIKYASQLCDSNISKIPIASELIIESWNPSIQASMFDENRATCDEILSGFGDFPLEPAKVYKIRVTQNVDWEQI